MLKSGCSAYCFLLFYLFLFFLKEPGSWRHPVRNFPARSGILTPLYVFVLLGAPAEPDPAQLLGVLLAQAPGCAVRGPWGFWEPIYSPINHLLLQVRALSLRASVRASVGFVTQCRT